MPAEWEPHEATWLGWPHHPTDWPRKLDTIRWVYGEMVRKLAPGEELRILVDSGVEERLARQRLDRAGAPLSRVRFVRHPTNRGWTRDSGPVFVRRGAGRRSETAIVDFHFNAWAKYTGLRQGPARPGDGRASVREEALPGARRAPGLRSRGRGIEVNGRGTLLTTEECYLSPRKQVRNPGLGAQGLRGGRARLLGVTHVFWLGRGIAGDDTHGHVDDLCRFVNPRTLVLIKEARPTDRNYRPLAGELGADAGELRLEDGSKPEVVALPMPEPLYHDGQRLPASYANFYVGERGRARPDLQRPERPRRSRHSRQAVPRPSGRRHPRGRPGPGLRHAPLPDAAAAGVAPRSPGRAQLVKRDAVDRGRAAPGADRLRARLSGGREDEVGDRGLAVLREDLEGGRVEQDPQPAAAVDETQRRLVSPRERGMEAPRVPTACDRPRAGRAPGRRRSRFARRDRSARSSWKGVAAVTPLRADLHVQEGRQRRLPRQPGPAAEQRAAGEPPRRAAAEPRPAPSTGCWTRAVPRASCRSVSTRGTVMALRQGEVGTSCAYSQLLIQPSEMRRPSCAGTSDHETAA